MKAGNTEKIREALKNSRTPKTCRELMEQAGMKPEEYKFAASILVGFTDRDRVMVAGVRECKVSGREAKVYEWERDNGKKKAPKKAVAKKAAKKPAPKAPAPKAPVAPAPAPAQAKSSKKAAPKAMKKAPVQKPAATQQASA